MDFEVDTTKNKLKLLFILDKMEIPLTENSLIDICTNQNNQWLGYMELKDILWQLEQVGFVYRSAIENEETRYGITTAGQECLSHFYQRLPLSLREKITEFSKENRMNFKRIQEYIGEYSKNPDGTYTVRLRIKEPILSSSLLDIKLKTPNRHSAIESCKKWKDRAAKVFEYLYDNVLDD